MRSYSRGQQLLAAGRYIEAAHALADALRGAMGDPTAPREAPYYISGVLQQARAHIGVLYVAADKGRDVTVDGVSVGQAPIIGEILLAPGKHRVVARGDVCLGTSDFEIKAGESRRLKVGCPSAPAWRAPSLVTGLSGGLLALTVGVATAVAAEGKNGEIAQNVQQAQVVGYAEPGLAENVRRAESARVDLFNASITSFLIGGSLLAATTAVFFGVKPRRPDEPAPLVGASVGAGQAGLWMRW